MKIIDEVIIFLACVFAILLLDATSGYVGDVELVLLIIIICTINVRRRADFVKEKAVWIISYDIMAIGVFLWHNSIVDYGVVQNIVTYYISFFSPLIGIIFMAVVENNLVNRVIYTILSTIEGILLMVLRYGALEQDSVVVLFKWIPIYHIVSMLVVLAAETYKKVIKKI